MTKEMDPDHVSGYCVFSAIVSASPPFAVIGGAFNTGLEMKHPKCSTKCLKEALTKSFDAKMGEVAIPLENDHKPDRSDERERIKHDQNSRCFSIDGHIPWTCEAFSKLHREDLVQAPSLLWYFFLFSIYNIFIESIGICSQPIWDRALGLPLERPKSVTMEWLENKCKK
ncbi:hypothetical protein LXL04_014002 [Taraxacum kok-saghyz]